MKQGFTLVELMIVIAIIGILAASLFPSMTGYIRRSRDAVRVADLRDMSSAVDAYFFDRGRQVPIYYTYAPDICFPVPPMCIPGPIIQYPTIDTGVLMRGGYLQIVPLDPIVTHSNGCTLNGVYCYNYLQNGENNYILSATFEGGPNAGNIPAFDMPVILTGGNFNQFKNTIKGSGSGYVLVK